MRGIVSEFLIQRASPLLETLEKLNTAHGTYCADKSGNIAFLHGGEWGEVEKGESKRMCVRKRESQRERESVRDSQRDFT